MLSAINAGVVRIRDRTHLFEETCRIAHDVGKYALAFVVLIDPGMRIARPVAWAGADDGNRDQVSFQVDGDLARDVTVSSVGGVGHSEVDDDTVTGALRTGAEAVCNDLLGAGSRLKFAETAVLASGQLPRFDSLVGR